MRICDRCRARNKSSVEESAMEMEIDSQIFHLCTSCQADLLEFVTSPAKKRRGRDIAAGLRDKLRMHP